MALTTTVWFAGPNRVQSSTRASTSEEEGTFEVEPFKPVSGHGIEDSVPLFNPEDNLFFLIEGDGRGNSSRLVTVKSDGENVVDFERDRVIGVGGALKRSKENGYGELEPDMREGDAESACPRLQCSANAESELADCILLGPPVGRGETPTLIGDTEDNIEEDDENVDRGGRVCCRGAMEQAWCGIGAIKGGDRWS